MPDAVSATSAPSRAMAHRPARFALVSILCGALAQAGLAFAYGLLHWSTTAAVLFSLAVSIGPSYWGSRTYVWSGLSRHSCRREVSGFVALALAGSAIAIALTSLTHLLGRVFTDDRSLLTVWVCTGSALATVVVWLTRYVVLDRFLFSRADDRPGPHLGSPMTTHQIRVPGPRRPGQTLDVSVVLPCLNEEESVGLCVTEAHEALAAAGLTGEVIVVDNGCTDRSAEVAERAGARVVRENVPGYGAAIRAGIAVAAGDVVVMADADCTYALDRVGELVQPVLDGETDLCLGSRLSAATRHSMPFLHRFVGTPALTFLVRQGGGYADLTDSQSGFRAFGREAVGSLALRSTGMEFASEMLLRASQAGWAVRELPLDYRKRVGESKLSTWRDGMRHLRLIIELSPYQLLWTPGLGLVALAVLLYTLGILAPDGVGVGSLVWQPVFFASICLVLGTVATLAAAVVGYHLPSSSASVRRRYRWVGHARFSRHVAGIGIAAVGAGVALDGALMVAWLSATGGQGLRLTLAGLAQGFILSGSIATVFALLYRLLLDLRDVPAAPHVAVPAEPALVATTTLR